MPRPKKWPQVLRRDSITVIHRLLHGTRPGWESDLRASREGHACHVAQRHPHHDPHE